MKPKSIIACIEGVRTVIDAQIVRLRTIPPQSARIERAAGSPSDGSAKLLSAHLTAQIVTTAELLGAMSDAEAAVRTSKSFESNAFESNVIEGEYKDVTS